MQKAFVPPKFLTMTEMESFLSKNVYLSGTENPGQIDSQMLDFLLQRCTLPERAQYPNCFSWYWALVCFDAKTRALWNPLHIDPSLSEDEPGKEGAEQGREEKAEARGGARLNGKAGALLGERINNQAEGRIGSQVDGQVDFHGSIRVKPPPKELKRFTEGSFASDWFSFDEGKTGAAGLERREVSLKSRETLGSDGLLKISHISVKQSHSANSGVQDWRELDLVGDLTRLGGRSQIVNERRAGSWDSVRVNTAREGGGNRKADAHRKTPATSQATIRAKVLPKNRGVQMQVLDLLEKSIGLRADSWKSFSSSTRRDAQALSDLSGPVEAGPTEGLEIRNTSSYSFTCGLRARQKRAAREKGPKVRRGADRRRKPSRSERKAWAGDGERRQSRGKEGRGQWG